MDPFSSPQNQTMIFFYSISAFIIIETHNQDRKKRHDVSQVKKKKRKKKGKRKFRLETMMSRDTSHLRFTGHL